VSGILERLERVERLLPPRETRPGESWIPEQAPVSLPRLPEVRVTIGRIEVHTPPTPAPPPRPAPARHPPPAARPVRSLDDYLARRQEKRK
jgi:hypothetical protein